ncbi:MAG: indole-3-glycerol-phosphate synthase [Candidatus Helarchaeota archaeon]|nr:indole-3-glycerol-phosphate synthase [Candidatus Helarchaeota archaeon]
MDKILKNRKNTLSSFLKNYRIPEQIDNKKISLIQRIKNCKTNPIISEIKFSSPSKGSISTLRNVEDLARKMELGGVVGISVLTEPNFFNGSFEILKRARKSVSLPILLKDFIFSKKQIYYGMELGANVVLLISKMLSKEDLQELYNLATSLELEVLLELHDIEDLNRIQGIKPRIIGINNRNLETLKVNLKTTIDLIPLIQDRFPNSIIISESGIYTNQDIKNLLKAGADAFLIGSSIMEAPNIELKLKELVGLN